MVLVKPGASGSQRPSPSQTNLTVQAAGHASGVRSRLCGHAPPSNLCPVTAVLSYIAIRGPAEGPLFTRANSHPLTRQWFVDRIHRALSLAGIDASAYHGHSFRIGAATTAADTGIGEYLIKTLGRWSSSAYQLYIRIPREQLATLAPMLAGSQN